MLSFEHQYWRKQPTGHLAGIDEAGRGPLAGPVYAAAVMITPVVLDELYKDDLAGLTDSKRLTARSRERFFGFLEAHPAVRIGVGTATVDEIDKLNILVATHLAMRRAALALGAPQPDHILVDGLPARGLPCSSTAIVKGDAKSLLIAAASVISKVTRDRVMRELGDCYPGYDFPSNKGYGTRAHLRALKKLGVTPVHRRSFAPVADMLQPSLFPDQMP